MVSGFSLVPRPPTSLCSNPEEQNPVSFPLSSLSSSQMARLVFQHTAFCISGCVCLYIYLFIYIYVFIYIYIFIFIY